MVNYFELKYYYTIEFTKVKKKKKEKMKKKEKNSLNMCIKCSIQKVKM